MCSYPGTTSRPVKSVGASYRVMMMTVGLAAVLACMFGYASAQSARAWTDERRICVDGQHVVYEYDGSGKLYVSGTSKKEDAEPEKSSSEARRKIAGSSRRRRPPPKKEAQPRCEGGNGGRVLALEFDADEYSERMANVSYTIKADEPSTGRFVFHVNKAVNFTAETAVPQNDKIATVVVKATMTISEPDARVPTRPSSCICTREYMPVCGDDNKTYGNRCLATCAGVLYKRGECPRTSPSDIGKHDEPLVSRPIGEVHPPQEGCMCVAMYAPVCGVNKATNEKMTYSNTCVASCEGATNVKDGECTETANVDDDNDAEEEGARDGAAGAIENDDDSSSEEGAEEDEDAMSDKVPESPLADDGCICPEIYAPVCARVRGRRQAIKMTFSNTCHARCAGATVVAKGICSDYRVSKSAHYIDERRLCVDSPKVMYEYDGAGKFYVNGVDNGAQNATSTMDVGAMRRRRARRSARCGSSNMGRVLAFQFDPELHRNATANVTYYIKTNLPSEGSFAFNVSEAMTYTAIADFRTIRFVDVATIFVKTKMFISDNRMRHQPRSGPPSFGPAHGPRRDPRGPRPPHDAPPRTVPPSTSEPCICTMEYAPVCGKDKITSKQTTFSNSCHAACQGALDIEEGECLGVSEGGVQEDDESPEAASDVVHSIPSEPEEDGAADDNVGHSEKEEKEVKEERDSESATDGSDACFCTKEFMPVCGSDGKTYGNKCEASSCARVSFTEGPCLTPAAPVDSKVERLDDALEGELHKYVETTEEIQKDIQGGEESKLLGDFKMDLPQQQQQQQLQDVGMTPLTALSNGSSVGVVPPKKSSSSSHFNVIGLAVGLCFGVVFLGLASRAVAMRRQRRASSASYYANSGLPKFTQRSGSDIGSTPGLSPTFSDIDQGPESFSAGLYAYKYSDGGSPSGSASPTVPSRKPSSILGSPDRRASTRRTTRTSIDIEDDGGLELIDSIQPEYIETISVDRVPSLDSHVQHVSSTTTTTAVMTANPMFAAQGTHTEEQAETGAKSVVHHVDRDCL